MSADDRPVERDVLFWIRAWAEGWMWVGVLLVTGLGASMVALSFDSAADGWRPLPVYMLRELGMGLITTALIAGVVRLFILRYHKRFQSAAHEFLQDDVTRRLNGLAQDVAHQTTELVSASRSLNAMNQAGIHRMYANRDDAASDMSSDLQDREVTEIRIIGISLNDFVRPEDKRLGDAWDAIVNYVRHADRVTTRMCIRIMVIDPHSAGALLRSAGELREQGRTSSRLQDDVSATVRHLLELREQSLKNERVDFDFRLYRVPPILFLCSTDRSCYVQQYHFWSTRSEAHIPVLASRVSSTSVTNSLMEEMRAHFDWVWEHASITPDQYDAGERGFDRYLQEAAATNVYTTAGAGKERIHWLLRNTERELWIQGISLKSFFDIDELFHLIGAAIKRGVVVRCLLLDPDSEQARYRSFREHLFTNDDMKFPAYAASNYHSESPLYQDTLATIKRIVNTLMPSIDGDFGARLYGTAPSCFMLMSDGRVLVEQYHYGKAQVKDELLPLILGKDMPLLEYHADTPDLFRTGDSRKNPYALLRQHFEFVYDKCSRDVTDFHLEEAQRNGSGPTGGGPAGGNGRPASVKS